MIPEMADAMLVTGGVFCVSFAVLVFVDRIARILKRF